MQYKIILHLFLEVKTSATFPTICSPLGADPGGVQRHSCTPLPLLHSADVMREPDMPHALSDWAGSLVFRIRLEGEDQAGRREIQGEGQVERFKGDEVNSAEP